MARNHEVADLPGHSTSARNHKLGDAVIHGFESIVIIDAEGHWDVDVEFWDDEAGVRSDRTGNVRVDRFDAGGRGFGIW